MCHRRFVPVLWLFYRSHSDWGVWRGLLAGTSVFGLNNCSSLLTSRGFAESNSEIRVAVLSFVQHRGQDGMVLPDDFSGFRMKKPPSFRRQYSKDAFGR